MKAQALELAHEEIELGELINDPAFAKLAIDPRAKAGRQFSATEKSIRDDEPATGLQQAMRFAEKSVLICVAGVARAFQGVGRVEGGGVDPGVLVVIEQDTNSLAESGVVIQSTCLFHLPRHQGDASELCQRPPGRNTPEGCAESTTKI